MGECSNKIRLAYLVLDLLPVRSYLLDTRSSSTSAPIDLDWVFPGTAVSAPGTLHTRGQHLDSP